MRTTTLIARRAGHAQVLRLQRPARRNALNIALMDELEHALRAAGADARVAGVVLTGGPEYFSAGADLHELSRLTTAPQCLEYFGRWQRLCEVLEGLEKPVLAAVEGFCLTGGLELALACDLRVAGAGATFAVTSARIGTIPAFGATQRLPRLVGPARALDLLLSARAVDAPEAQRLGLIDRLVPAGQALAEAKRLVEGYAELAPLSLALLKRAVHQGLSMDLRSGLGLEAALATAIYGTEDRREGISAFLQKRKPRFKGK